MIHGIFHVITELIGDTTESRGHQQPESTHKPVVIQHDKNHIQENNKPPHYAENHMQPPVNHGHSIVEHGVEILIHQFLCQMFEIDITLEYVMDFRGQVTYGYIRRRIFTHQFRHLVQLVDNRRYEEINQYGKEQGSLEKGDKNGSHAPLEPQYRTVILHKRF